MALQRKLGRATDQRMALLKNQVTALLWNGKIETTFDRAKEVSRMAEKILTLAINSFEDTVKQVETRKVKTKKKKEIEIKEVEIEIINDGPKKLNARRKIMSQVYHVEEQREKKEPSAAFRARTEKIQHPLIEKIFNEYAPKYAARNKELSQAGGYTRVLKLGCRRGDSAEGAIIELV